MDRCRNCDATNLRDLGFIGNLAPFFLKRVLRAEMVLRRSYVPRKRKIQQLTRLPQRILSRIHPTAAAVELQSCLNCSFVQTRYPFSDEGLGRLYEDYRSDSYNRERAYYEPEYAAIAANVGNYTENGLGRVESLTFWLKSKATLDGFSILDYGGADGKFLPDLPCDKFVYEISNIKPAPGVTRVAGASELQTYGYVQLSHVLEHVTQPLQMTRQVAALVEPGGYLLVEVPQDVDTPTLQNLQHGNADRSITIHEHINLYSALAVQKLIEASGLEIVALDAIPVESAITKQFFIRGLARRQMA